MPVAVITGGSKGLFSARRHSCLAPVRFATSTHVPAAKANPRIRVSTDLIDRGRETTDA